MMEISIQPTTIGHPKTVKELANWLRYVVDHLDKAPDVPLLPNNGFYEFDFRRDDKSNVVDFYFLVESLEASVQDTKKKLSLVPPTSPDESA